MRSLLVVTLTALMASSALAAPFSTLSGLESRADTSLDKRTGVFVEVSIVRPLAMPISSSINLKPDPANESTSLQTTTHHLDTREEENNPSSSIQDKSKQKPENDTFRKIEEGKKNKFRYQIISPSEFEHDLGKEHHPDHETTKHEEKSDIKDDQRRHHSTSLKIKKKHSDPRKTWDRLFRLNIVVEWFRNFTRIFIKVNPPASKATLNLSSLKSHVHHRHRYQPAAKFHPNRLTHGNEESFSTRSIFSREDDANDHHHQSHRVAPSRLIDIFQIDVIYNMYPRRYRIAQSQKVVNYIQDWMNTITV
ncbi:hypothetical protein ABKN59_004547 [Abortiporus biennis]